MKYRDCKILFRRFGNAIVQGYAPRSSKSRRVMLECMYEHGGITCGEIFYLDVQGLFRPGDSTPIGCRSCRNKQAWLNYTEFSGHYVNDGPMMGIPEWKLIEAEEWDKFNRRAV